MLDVSQFTPEEITVKATDRNIVIHGDDININYLSLVFLFDVFYFL